MKHLQILFYILITLQINAQTKIQNGKVREINSDKKPLQNVYIKFTDAVPTTSDDNGNFRLAFSGKKDGELIFMEKIEKSGYEIVNKKELEVLTISDNDQLPTDIIMAKKGFLAAAKKEYYDVSDAALLASFEREKTGLRQQLQQSKITQTTFLEQKKALEEQYDAQKIALDAMAEQFARVNFDDVDTLYKTALQLFKAGKINESILYLENADLIGRVQMTLQKINNYEEALRIAKADLKRALPSMQLLAQEYVLSFEVDKAENLYDNILLIDSTNIDILREAVEFYNSIHNYHKSLKIYNLIKNHGETNLWEMVNVLVLEGKIYSSIKNKEYALKSFLNAYDLLSKNKPFKEVGIEYQLFLGHIYGEIGVTYSLLGNLNYAFFFLQKYNRQSLELYEKYKGTAEVEKELGLSYFYLGDMYRQKGDLSNALNHFKKSEKILSISKNNQDYNLSFIYKKTGDIYILINDLNKAMDYYEKFNSTCLKLTQSFPENINNKSQLAVSYEKMSTICISLKKLNKAYEYALSGHHLAKELYNKYPYESYYKNTLSISYSKLGEIEKIRGNLDLALDAFIKGNKIAEEAVQLSKDNTLFTNGLAFSYIQLGEVYSAMGKLEYATNYFKQGNIILSRLALNAPTNLSFQEDFIKSLLFLASNYLSMNNYDKALVYYSEANTLAKKLNESNLQNTSFRSYLVISYSNLGVIYTQKYNYDLALEAFEKEHNILKEIYLTDSLNISLKNKLALSSDNLGKTHIALGNFKLAFEFFEFQFQLFNSLYKNDINNAYFQNALAFSYVNLANAVLEQKDYLRGNNYLLQAEKHFAKLYTIFPENVQIKQYLEEVRNTLNQLKEAGY